MTVMHPSDRTYRSQTVRLADLTVISDLIENVTFENCIIEGPAVIALMGQGTLRDCGFDGDLESLIWIVPAEREKVIGAIAMIDCTLVGCTLRRIGLAVPEADLDHIRRGLGG